MFMRQNKNVLCVYIHTSHSTFIRQGLTCRRQECAREQWCEHRAAAGPQGARGSHGIVLWMELATGGAACLGGNRGPDRSHACTRNELGEILAA